MASLSNLSDSITSTLANLPPQDQIQDGERMRLLGLVEQLQTALEPPFVPLQRFCVSHYGIVMIRIAQGMGVFDAFVQSQSADLSLKELSSKVKGEEKLLKRVMHFLCAYKVFTQPTSEVYKPAPLAMMLGGMPGDMVKHIHNIMQISAKLFEYFENNGYKNPEDAFEAPFQFAYNTKQHYFDWLQTQPEAQSAFNSVMTFSQQLRGKNWFEIYPVAEKLNSSSDRVLLVDIGGGVGHDVIAFKKRFPDMVGELVVQDLPQVIESIDEALPDGIIAIGHNMFEPQPIRGAKAYYLRTVLHDWPDKQALDVLARIREVMAEDSVLLINEHTAPESLEVPVIPVTLDIQMMEVFSSLERTEEEWVSLLERAQFKVAKVWKVDTVGTLVSLFEAIL
ncbi:Demethylsterigmatocystin 6-O-methyltransferase [Talaromyces pinophilus]|nr:Demethylsterigmatocystin 6-O-methyltransferase [Talaromyces pinophilus]